MFVRLLGSFQLARGRSPLLSPVARFKAERSDAEELSQLRRSKNSLLGTTRRHRRRQHDDFGGAVGKALDALLERPSHFDSSNHNEDE